MSCTKPTIDIPVWDNSIQYRADLYTQPQTVQTVLHASEAAATEEIKELAPTLVGRQIGMACVAEVLGTKTRERVLVFGIEEAKAWISKLDQFVKSQAANAKSNEAEKP